MTNRFAWAFTTVTLFGAAAMVAACSDEASTSKLPVAVQDSGSNTNTDSGNTTTTDAGGTCKDTTPPTVRAAGVGPFCPFSAAANDAGTSFKGVNCGAGETCCSATGNSGKTGTCTADATCAFEVPTNGTRWECAGTEHCGTGAKCYLVHTTRDGAKPLEVKVDLGCADNFLVAANTMGTSCKTEPAADDIEVCARPGSADAGVTVAGCPAGKTCTAFSTYGRDLGYCK